MEQQNKKSFYKNWLLWIIVAIVVFGLIVIGILNSLSSKTTTGKLSQLDMIAKQIISSYLKSPGSAQFPELIIKKSISTENQYIVFGDVDSQNSFGGLMRSHFFLTIIDKGGDAQNINNWTINSLDLGDVALVSNGKELDPPLPLSGLSEEARRAQKQLEDIYRGPLIEDLERGLK
jgi:hypothetical protein